MLRLEITQYTLTNMLMHLQSGCDNEHHFEIVLSGAQQPRDEEDDADVEGDLGHVHDAADAVRDQSLLNFA